MTIINIDIQVAIKMGKYGVVNLSWVFNRLILSMAVCEISVHIELF